MGIFSARIAIPAACALLACAPPARAGDARIDRLEQQLGDVQRRLAALKDDDRRAAPVDLQRATGKQFAVIDARLARQPRTGLDQGRFTIVSADGAFSLSLRATVQMDAGYFAQGRNPPGFDLNSGTNFRRAQFGMVGTAWRDWSYNFTYDFGGSGTERSGYLYRAYLQYDGLGPLGFRIGAFAPFAGLEDATGGANLTFLERASAANVARGIGGASGREGVSVFAQGERTLVSLAYTGGRTTESATFDEQQALVGRASYLVADGEWKWLVDANATHVFKVADMAATTPGSFAFSAGPELAIDATRTVNTGAIDARAVTEYGFETAAGSGPFYGQGGWFHYGITRPFAPDPDFSGWYAMASWSLTGEARRYDPTVAAFRALRPDHPLGSPGGLGAWEIKARYSSIDLDFLPNAESGGAGIGGGVQHVWSTGLNWTPTAGLRFLLDYDNIAVHHGGAPAGGITASAVALQSQIAF